MLDTAILPQVRAMARRRSYIERVARPHQHHVEAFALSFRKQGHIVERGGPVGRVFNLGTPPLYLFLEINPRGKAAPLSGRKPGSPPPANLPTRQRAQRGPTRRI